VGRIIELDYSTVVKIAAGEVIDRPASVVRELLDNAIDAQADWITIYISNGGKSYIEVSDNGIGMDKEDLLLCIKNHTTSKIKSFDDLENLKTLGFRGEALSSIAEVSKLKIISKAKDSNTAFSLYSEGGNIIEVKETSRDAGTKVIVEDLFFNLPAREKFLGSATTELKLIEKEITKKALPFFNLGFEFYSDGKRKFVNPKRKSCLERIYDFFPDVVEDLLLIERIEKDFSFTGYISKPNFIRPNRLYEYFFVNQRPVEWKSFYYVIQNVYGEILPKGYFPAVFIYLSINPSLVDVNVHPMKKEVKFKDEQKVIKSIIDSMQEVLNIGNVYNAGEKLEFTQYEKKISEAIRDYFVNSQDKSSPDFSKINATYNNYKIKEETLFSLNTEKTNQQKSLSSLRYVGVAFNTYIILEDEDILYLVDQHAAHERINYEKFKKIYSQKVLSSVNLLVPVKVDVPYVVLDDFLANLSILKGCGFDIEHFGQNTFVVRSAPAFVDYEMVGEVILGFIESLEEKKSNVSDFLDESIRQIACKASIKAGNRINENEVKALLSELENTPNNLTCPHGRPIIVSFSRNDLAKLFKRTGF
jgi:DNA mismatch repair protein MutL